MKEIRLTKEGFPDVDSMTWSFSRLNGFDNGCKYCWYQNYILRRRDSIQNAFAEYGTFCHELHEKYEKGELMIWDLVEDFKKNYMFEVRSKFPPNKYVNLTDTYYRQGIDYFTKFKGYPEHEIIAVEEKLNVNIEGYDFTGYIDLILKDKTDGGIIVMDHKSKSKFKSKKEQFEYARQLYLYSIHIKEEYGVYPKQLIFNMFRKQHKVIIPFNEQDYFEAQEWMLNVINEISRTTEFAVTDSDFFGKYLCNYREDDNHKKGHIQKIKQTRI